VSEYSEFFLGSPASDVELELIEISHPNFTQTYRIVRNATAGVTVTHEDSNEYEYVYRPLRLSLTGPRDDLEHILKVDLGDLGQIVPMELDEVRAANGFGTLPSVVYRVYSSADLTTILFGPVHLKLKSFNSGSEGSSFEAKARSLAVSRTGEVYTLPRFPMLGGLT
jgi:hypothetical protein